MALSLVIAISQLIVYALINKNLGKESLGVWSLIVAATSIGQISNFGFSNSLVRYLPELLLKNRKEDIKKLLGTVNFSIFFLTFPILLLLYLPAIEYASNLLNHPQLTVFKSIIPISMAGLFVSNMFSVYSYLLDAMQKYYLRSVVQISGWIFFLIISLALMPDYGLMGVAIAFFTQNILQFVIIIIVVKKTRTLNKVYPINFSKGIFRQISSFGLKSQMINVLVIFFDPAVKFFITKNLGLLSTANYEISNKIVMQIRNLLVSANQVIIPKIILHRNAGTENKYFNSISTINIFLSIAAGILILLIAPVAVLFFQNDYDNTLTQCIIILNVGWVCNMITSVHYYSCIGLDKIGQLVIYHLLLSIVLIIFYISLPLYPHLKSLYFAVPTTALFFGSIYNSYILSKKIKNSFKWLGSGIFLYFIFVSLVALVVAYTKVTLINYLIIPAFFLVYIYWMFFYYKTNKLFKR